MKTLIKDASVLLRIMESEGWADINQLYEACKREDVFKPDFYDTAVEWAMKAEIRRALKGGKLRDADGNVVDVASIVITDKNNRKRRVYKQEQLFDVGDCVQAIHYWKGYTRKGQERVQHFAELAIRLHGPQVQGLLPLDD